MFQTIDESSSIVKSASSSRRETERHSIVPNVAARCHALFLLAPAAGSRLAICIMRIESSVIPSPRRNASFETRDASAEAASDAFSSACKETKRSVSVENLLFGVSVGAL